MDTSTISLDGPALRAAIAVEILGWKLCKGGVPKDANGENDGDILTPDGKPMEGYNYPPKGEIHAAHHVPSYDYHFGNALQLAQHVGLPDPAWKLPMDGEGLARRCLEYWRKTHLPA